MGNLITAINQFVVSTGISIMIAIPIIAALMTWVHPDEKVENSS